MSSSFFHCSRRVGNGEREGSQHHELLELRYSMQRKGLHSVVHDQQLAVHVDHLGDRLPIQFAVSPQTIHTDVASNRVGFFR